MSHFKKVFILTLVTFFFSGCAKDEPQGLSDAELIQAIIDADNKIEVEMESLPSSAKSTMQDSYLSEYYHLQSLKASMLGYEVSIAGRPGRLGKRSEIYFDVQGKKLDYSEFEKDYWSYEDDLYTRSKSGDKRDWECFSIEYPITVTTPIGNTYVFEDEESIEEYYEAYEIDEDVSVVYPINITDNDGELITIDSDERLEEVYKNCYGRGRDWDENKNCFSIVYPVSYLMPDGTTIEIPADDEDSWAEFKSWYDNNSETDERPSLQYPVEIIYEIDGEEGAQDQRVVTINNEDEMMAAKEECREVWGEEYDHWEEESECFELVYPVSYLMPDGTTIEIPADDEDSWAEFKSWYDNNSETDERPSLQYPVEIIYEIDGEEGAQDQRVVTINNEDEMMAAKEECGEEESEDNEERECYEYVYPITFILPDESTVEISSEDDESGWGLIRRFYEENSNYEEEPALQFPVEIIVEGDVVLDFDTSEAWEEFLDENCDRQD